MSAHRMAVERESDFRIQYCIDLFTHFIANYERLKEITTNGS